MSFAGGYAVALHGAVWGTVDIDIVLPFSEKVFLRAEKALMDLGLQPPLPVRAEDVFRFREEYVRNRNMLAWSFHNPNNPVEIVDILITTDLKKCRTKTIPVAGRKIRLISLPDLIRMKEGTGRPQDQADVETLSKILKDHTRGRK